MRSTVVAAGVTATRAGSRSIASASSAMSFGIVAEKNSGCRLIGVLATIFQNAVQDRQRERRGLAGAGLGDADDVTAGECEGDGLSLDGRGRQIILFLERTRDGIGKAEILKGGQKVGSFHYKRQAPGRLSARSARGGLNTPAC